MLGLSLSVAAILAVVAADSQPSQGNNTMVNSWTDVPVSVDLRYIPCFKNFTCAYLQVPLDYGDLDAGTTNIAFIKYSSPSQSVMGDIIYNPGGPGESGIEQILSVPQLKKIIDLIGESYNIVGMDPRGVGQSGPNVDCFLKNPAAGLRYIEQLRDLRPSCNTSVAQFYETSGAYGTWCKETLNDTARYVNTPATARDMTQYFEKLAESQYQSNTGQVLVNFYGVSYGTILGTTFAALYPDRVGRFVLDGVADAVDYYNGNGSQTIRQADQIVEAFFDLCAKAGPNLCALNNNGTFSADQIKNRVDRLIDAVGNIPVPVTDPNFVDYPTVIESIDLQSTIELALYNPSASWYSLSTELVQLEQGNGSLLAQSSGKGIMPTNNSVPRSTYSMWMILCNDNNHHYQNTLDNLFKLFMDTEKISKYIGDLWTLSHLPMCRNLNFTPPGSQLFSGFRQTQTKTPILFLDNVVDPVTSAYYRMSAFFEKSVVLLQNAVGHGTFVVASSSCTSGYVQRYLKDTTLPPVNTTCDTNFDPFVEPKM